jgi:molecular chaperone GrpE
MTHPKDGEGQAERPAGPVGAGDPPPPPVAEASSGVGPPTPPPAGGADQVVDDLDALLADTQKERDEYLDLAKRTKADFENYRRRMAAEVEAAGARGKADLVGGLLGVIDNLERALTAAGIDPTGESAPEEPLAEGIVLTYRELCSALKLAGVESDDPTGEKFDPARHEALQKLPADGAEPGTVLEVLQKGYRLGEQLIRPARVVVAE